MQVWEAMEEGVEGDAAFEAGEGSTETVMDAVAEGEVFVGCTLDVEAIGLVEVSVVAVGGGEGDADDVAALNMVALEGDIATGPAGGGGFDGAIVA